MDGGPVCALRRGDEREGGVAEVWIASGLGGLAGDDGEIAAAKVLGEIGQQGEIGLGGGGIGGGAEEADGGLPVGVAGDQTDSVDQWAGGKGGAL